VQLLTALAAQDSVDEFNRRATARMGLATLAAVGLIVAAIAAVEPDNATPVAAAQPLAIAAASPAAP
jgi:hypothetical protein